MLEKHCPKIDFFVFFALFLFVFGCTGETVSKEQKIDFALEAQALESIYAETGFSNGVIQRIDSKELLEKEERTGLNSKLSILEQKLKEFLLKASGYPEQREKSALIALIETDLSRTNYLKAMVELKDSEKFNGVINAFESFDFNAFPDRNKCLDLEKAKPLKEAYLKAENSAELLSNQIRLFNESFSEFSQTARIEQRTPLLEKTGFWEFIECSELIFNGCNTLTQSISILSEMEQAAKEQNLCFSLKDLGENIESLEALVSELDSFSEKAASLKALALDSKVLEEERKALLSISTEFKEFQKQLKKECE